MAEATDVIESEICSIKDKVPGMDGLQLVACVPAIIRIHIKLTNEKQLSVCMHFPEKYPHDSLIIELKSKTLADRLLNGLTKVCDTEVKKVIGSRQVLYMVKFIKMFLQENPMCVCSEEFHHLKHDLLEEGDDIKLKQKTSQIQLNIKKDSYFMNIKLTIPDLYPERQLDVEVCDHNFPELLAAYFQAQAIEISRRCVQPPLKKNPKEQFQPKPSLRRVCDFLIKDCIKHYPVQKCPLCQKYAMSPDPKAPYRDAALGLERNYCGHLYHNGCLDKYMKKPPFTGGKKCPACGNRIFHEKWKVTPQLAEARWAHKEARERELDEVVEFLQ